MSQREDVLLRQNAALREHVRQLTAIINGEGKDRHDKLSPLGLGLSERQLILILYKSPRALTATELNVRLPGSAEGRAPGSIRQKIFQIRRSLGYNAILNYGGYFLAVEFRNQVQGLLES